MATKLYLHNANSSVSGTLPSTEQSSLTADSNFFTGVTDADNKSMDTTKSAVSQSNLTNTSTGDTNSHNYYIMKWVSPLIYQTQLSAQTWSFEFAAKEANAAANFPVTTSAAGRINCYVWKPSNGTKVGTVLDGNTGTISEAGTSQTVISGTFSGSAVTGMTPGDAVLVFELWAIVTQGNGTARVVDIYYDGTTENSTTNEAAFISTPEGISFAAVNAQATYCIAANGAATNASTANTTQYWACVGGADLGPPQTTEANMQVKFRTAGVLSNLQVYLSANTVVGTNTYTLRKNAADGNQVVSVPSTATGLFEDTANTDTIAATDLICVKSIHGAATNTFTPRMMGCFFRATGGDTYQKFSSFGPRNITSASATNYITINGNCGASATENNAKQRIRQACTMKNGSLYVSANARTTTTTFTTRLNGVDGAVTMSVGSGATGVFEDTSHSDTVASGDDYNWKYTSGTGTETLTMESLSIECLKTSAVELNVLSASDSLTASVALSTTTYLNIQGHNRFSTTENNSKSIVRCQRNATTLYDLFARVSANTITASTTVTARINGADGNNTLSIGSGATGLFSDTSHTDTIKEGDQINYKLITGGSGTDISFTTVQIHLKGTGTDYPRNINDTALTVSDSIDRSYGPNRTISDTAISVSDSVARVIGYPRSINESSISVSDALAVAQVLSRTISESAISVSDSIARRIDFSRIITESSISVSDALDRTIAFFRTLPETVTTSDAVARVVDLSRAISEGAISVGDSLARTVTNTRTLLETVSSGETLDRTYNANRNPQETTSVSDQLDRSVTNSRSLPETTNVSDDLQRTYNANRSLPETISSSDQLDRSVANTRSLPETVSVSDALDRVYNAMRSLPETTGVSDALARMVEFFRNLPETVNSSDSVDGQFQSGSGTNFPRNLSDSVSVSDQLDRSVNNTRELPETVSVSDQLDRTIAFFRSLPETVTTSDAVTRVVGFFCSLPETVASSDVLDKVQVLGRSLADTVISSDTVVRSVELTRALSDTVTSSDVVSRAIAFFRSLSDTTTSGDSVARTYNANRNLSDSVSSSSQLSRAVTLVRNLAETVGITDLVSRATHTIRALIDSISIGDSVDAVVAQQVMTVQTADIPLILTRWLSDNWTDDPTSTVEHYLIPPKSKITFGSRFDMSAGTHSDMHVHVRNVSKNVEQMSTDATVEDNTAIASIFVEVRYIPDTPPDFSGDTAGAPSDMMWQIRSYIDELIRSDPEQLAETYGIEVISIMQEIPDANTPADVHAQNVIENMYQIVIMVKCFYTLKIDRQA